MKKKERIKAVLMASMVEGLLSVSTDKGLNFKHERVIHKVIDISPCVGDIYRTLAESLDYIYALRRYNPGPLGEDNELTAAVCFHFGQKIGMLILEDKEYLTLNKHVVFSILTECIYKSFYFPRSDYDEVNRIDEGHV
jgi:predicted nucleic acid-binding protein